MRFTHRSLAWLASITFLFSVSTNVQGQTIAATDSRITYVGGGWASSNGHEFTSSSGSFSLDFTGNAVSWSSRRLHDGATVSVTLDNGNADSVDLSEGTTADESDNSATVQVVYSKAGLENANHHLNVAWNGPGSNGIGTMMENWSIEYVLSYYLMDDTY